MTTNQPATYPVDRAAETVALALGTATRALAAGRPLDAAESLRLAGAALDALQRRAVREAREAGASWSDVGAVLGTSKQAAQQRYGA